MGVEEGTHGVVGCRAGIACGQVSLGKCDRLGTQRCVCTRVGCRCHVRACCSHTRDTHTHAPTHPPSTTGGYPDAFLKEFAVFLAELREFFSAGKLEDMLRGLGPSLDDGASLVVDTFLASKRKLDGGDDSINQIMEVCGWVCFGWVVGSWVCFLYVSRMCICMLQG